MVKLKSQESAPSFPNLQLESNLPPLVANWLGNVNDDTLPMYIRENYFYNLQSLVNNIQQQLDLFKKQQTKANAIIVNKKKGK